MTGLITTGALSERDLSVVIDAALKPIQGQEAHVDLRERVRGVLTDLNSAHGPIELRSVHGLSASDRLAPDGTKPYIVQTYSRGMFDLVIIDPVNSKVSHYLAEFRESRGYIQGQVARQPGHVITVTDYDHRNQSYSGRQKPVVLILNSAGDSRIYRLDEIISFGVRSAEDSYSPTQVVGVKKDLFSSGYELTIISAADDKVYICGITEEQYNKMMDELNGQERPSIHPAIELMHSAGGSIRTQGIFTNDSSLRPRHSSSPQSADLSTLRLPRAT